MKQMFLFVSHDWAPQTQPTTYIYMLEPLCTLDTLELRLYCINPQVSLQTRDVPNVYAG